MLRTVGGVTRGAEQSPVEVVAAAWDHVGVGER